MAPAHELVRGLGVWAAASMVVGTVIGSGIFLVANSMMRGSGSPSAVLAVWVFGGLLSLAGALAYAELGAMLPEAGGEYVYLRESYGPLWGFLYGWSQFLVMKTASIATLAAGFALYFTVFFPALPLKAVAVSVVAILGAINYFGVRTGGAVQTFFTVLKVGLILALLLAALFSGSGDWSNFRTAVPVESPVSGFVLALVAALWAYDGWNNISMAGGEVANPQRNIPRSLILGVMMIGAVYILANIAYFYILPAADVAKSEVVAADVARRFMGEWGGRAVSLAAMTSIFAALNGSILAASRVPFAMARDRIFFAPLAAVHPRYHSPHIAVIVQCVAGGLMALTGNYEQLFTYVVFASWIYYGLTASAVFVLRKKHPEWPRPYKALGYPVLPALFVIISGLLVVMTIREQAWWRSLVGLGIIAAGIPVYYFFRGRAARAAAVLALFVLVPALPAAGPGRPEVLLFALHDAAAVETLRLRDPSANVVSPQWFSISAQGTIAGVASEPLLRACRERRISVMPAVFNRDFSPEGAAQFLADRQARRRVIRGLSERARRHGFRGYVMDFENLQPGPAARKRYTAFLKELHEQMRRQRLELLVALPAPSVKNRDAFDYKEIGRLADRVVLMAYDQHGRFNPPGPIAGYGWVESVVKEALEDVPRHKLLLGVAFYHRNWGEAAVTAGSFRDAVALREEYGAQWRWDPVHRAHYFGFVNDGRSHTVWLEDARSLAEKLALARRYQLAGVAGWRIGQEDPGVWVMLRAFRDKK